MTQTDKARIKLMLEDLQDYLQYPDGTEAAGYRIKEEIKKLNINQTQGVRK